MSEYQAVFERKEKKYLLTMDQHRSMRELLAQHMEEDQYGLHTVNSIYLDTDSYDIIQQCSSHPAYKEKVRLRSYGTPGPLDTVYLELKKKIGGVVYKRRIGMPLREAERYLQAGVRPTQHGQIFEEIDWAIGRANAKPKICISYDRVALFGKEDPSFRITFDYKMRFRQDHLSLKQGSFGTYLISPDLCLMEVKAAGAMPLWLTRFLSENKIFPVSFSKYGTAYRQHICEKGDVSHVG